MKRDIILFIYTIALSLICNNGISQHYVPVNTFTTDNGLPSNHIYDMVEDNQGFLWIATNNGVSRFDGKYFQNFSVNDGLPSNDAIQVVKNGCGTIWVNCYLESPVYFDEKSNRFVRLKDVKELETISKSYLRFSVTNQGDIYLNTGNPKNSFLLKANDTSGHAYTLAKSPFQLSVNGYNYLYNWSTDYLKKNSWLNFFDKEILVDSIMFPIIEKITYLEKGTLIIQTKSALFRLTINSLHSNSYSVDTLHFSSIITRLLSLGNNKLIVITPKMVYLTDEAAFIKIDSIENTNEANTAYNDRNNVLWIGTMDKGLVHYATSGVKQTPLPSGLINPNFLSLAISPKGSLFAGNYYGEQLIKDKQNITKHILSSDFRSYWIRKTFWVNNQVVTINEHSCDIGTKRRILIQEKNNGSFSIKSAAVLNDSTLILGTIKGLIHLHLNTGLYYLINRIKDRTLGLVKGEGNVIYYIRPDGLNVYDFDKNENKFIVLDKYLQNGKVSTLAFSADNILWAATTNGNILLVKNNQYIATINNGIGLPQNVMCMAASKNRIWIGSKSGITVLLYTYKDGVLHYKINNISKTDGLPSNVINDFAFYNDTVYAATENGIATIPFNFPVFRANIIPQLTDVRVNQQRIAIADHFSFAANQNNIALTFAGVDLTGHFLKMQYTTDNDTLWSDLQGNTLNMQLYSGTHQIKIRAVDVNNNAGKNILKLHFAIATPFYKQWWFLTLIALLFPGLIFWYFFNRRKKLLHNQFEKKLLAERVEFEKILAVEKAGNRITADLHDDIGTNLSSINIYSNVARQLIETDTSKAREILIKLSEQSRNMLDNLGEIIWSLKTGKEQFVNIESRIKNYVSDMLSVTNMHYTIEIEPRVNEIKNMRLRKNTLLIVKESINNAVKYSRATEVFVKMRTENNQLVIEIMDNGIGFDKEQDANGNGLGNMHKRTEELKGTFNLTSNQGKGTHIIVTIPLMELEEEF